jgi:hypothetical protein
MGCTALDRSAFGSDIVAVDFSVCGAFKLAYLQPKPTSICGRKITVGVTDKSG